MGYKEAEMIELHDAKVQISKTSYSDAVVGWGEFEPEDIETIYVDGQSLDNILKAFGIESQAWQEYNNR